MTDPYGDDDINVPALAFATIALLMLAAGAGLLCWAAIRLILWMGCAS